MLDIFFCACAVVTSEVLEVQVATQVVAVEYAETTGVDKFFSTEDQSKGSMVTAVGDRGPPAEKSLIFLPPAPRRAHNLT